MEGPRWSLFTLLQIVGVGALAWLLVRWTTPWNSERYVGTFLAVVGVSFIALARYQLGKSFSNLSRRGCTRRFGIQSTSSERG